jgi:hypothetical protein
MSNQTPLEQSYLPEAFVAAMFGLNLSNRNDVAHLAQLRRQGLAFCRISRKVRLYPRSDLEAFLSSKRVRFDSESVAEAE